MSDDESVSGDDDDATNSVVKMFLLHKGESGYGMTTIGPADAGPFTGVYVSEVPEKGSAYGSGVRAGMKVVAVNGHSAGELTQSGFQALVDTKSELVLTLHMDKHGFEKLVGKNMTAAAGGGAAPPSAPDDSLVKEGILRKKAIGKSTGIAKSILGSIMKDSWKDRFFRLTKQRLEYFEKGGTKAKGGVDVACITGVEVSSGVNPGFEILCKALADGHISSGGYKLVCEAESEEERALWINAICSVLVVQLAPAPQDVASLAGSGAASGLVIKEGVLRKNANGKSTKKTMMGSMRQMTMGDSWKDRYFCLTADRFEYFASKGAPKPKGGVDVDNINGVEVFQGGRGTGFEVHCNIMSDGSVDADGFKLICEAETEEEQMGWINAILTTLVVKTEKKVDRALKEGVLRKKARSSIMVGSGMSKESWKDRWFRLSQTRFEYFADKGSRKGGVELRHIDGFQIAEGTAEFEVRYSSVLPDGTSKQYKLICQADTKAVRDEWLKAIREAKEALAHDSR
jgi:hypothetical protein